MGPDPPGGAVPEQSSAQGCVTAHWEAAEEAGGGSWGYPPLVAAIAEADFEEIGDYVMRRHNTVAQYVVTRPILDLFEWSVWRPGVWVSWRWWEQEVLYLEGAKARAAAESDGEEAQCEEEGTAQDETTGQE